MSIPDKQGRDLKYGDRVLVVGTVMMLDKLSWAVVISVPRGHTTEIDSRELTLLTSPEIGEELVCLLCSRKSQWGTFDQSTGSAICVDCRDARSKLAAAETERDKLRKTLEQIFYRTTDENIPTDEAVHWVADIAQAALDHGDKK